MGEITRTNGWARVDGLRVYTRRFLPAHGSAQGDVVLVPGLAISGRYMVPLAHRLAQRWRVWVPDLPGSGRTDHPPQAPTPRRNAQWLLRWMDVVGLERASLVANSLGCQLALYLAAEAPGRVDRIVLISTPFEPGERRKVRQIWRFAISGVKEPPGLIRLAAEDYLRAGIIRTWRSFRAALQDHVEDVLPRVTAPVLLVRGRKDRVSSRDWNRQLARGLRNAQRVELPRAVHAPHYDATSRLAEVVEAFLGSTGSSAQSVVRSLERAW